MEKIKNKVIDGIEWMVALALTTAIIFEKHIAI